LAHELIHAERASRGSSIDYKEKVLIFYKDPVNGRTWSAWVKKEDLATVGIRYNTKKDITENMIRKNLGKFMRWNY
jgi:hypothetical protein